MCLAIAPQHEQELPMAFVEDTNDVIRSPRPRSNSNVSSSDYSTASSNTASTSNTTSTLTPSTTAGRRKPRRRNRSKRAKSSNQINPNTPVVVALTPEEQAQYIAMDCEMVGVGNYGNKSALARVTLVDWNGHIVYDAYIQPQCPVTDYRTFVSGITKEDLEDAGSFEACVAEVSALLEGKILIGHALKNDLNALKIKHPWAQTRDTGKYDPFMKTRFNDGALWPRKLKELVHEKLHREIQTSGQAHSPLEDAIAALDLYKSVRAKWEKVMAYKISKTLQIEQQQQQQQQLTQ